MDVLNPLLEIQQNLVKLPVSTRSTLTLGSLPMPFRQVSLLSASEQNSELSSAGPALSDVTSSNGRKPPQPKMRMAKQLVNTQLCKHFLKGYCRYHDKCAYAHRSEELVPKPNLQKTKVCASFLSGVCSSSTCSYAHGLSELRQACDGRDGTQNSRFPFEYGSQTVSAASDAAPGGGFLQDLHRVQSIGRPDEVPPSKSFQRQSLKQQLMEAASAHNAAQQQFRQELHERQMLQTRQAQHLQQARQVQQAWQSRELQPAPCDLDRRYGQLSAVPLGPEADTQLCSDLLVELLQMMAKEEAPQQSRWHVLSQRLLREGRRKNGLEGNFLMNAEGRKETLTFAEEQIIAAILLRDQQWASTFPELSHHCSAQLARRLQSIMSGENEGFASSSWNGCGAAVSSQGTLMSLASTVASASVQDPSAMPPVSFANFSA